MSLILCFCDDRCRRCVGDLPMVCTVRRCTSNTFSSNFDQFNSKYPWKQMSKKQTFLPAFVRRIQCMQIRANRNGTRFSLFPLRSLKALKRRTSRHNAIMRPYRWFTLGKASFHRFTDQNQISSKIKATKYLKCICSVRF